VRIVILWVALVACGNREREAPPVVERKPPPPLGCESPGGTVCVEDEVVRCSADRKLGAVVERCNGGCNAGKCIETCALRDVELVYVVDADHNLASFDPRKLPNDPFHPIGRLTCDSRSSPFSMAVDRLGVAWINYHNGVLYKVSIVDGKCKQAVTTDGAPHEFGMGFVSDGPNAQTEKLFVAAFNDVTLAELDVSQKRPKWKPVGTFTSSKNPELTGTGGGQLFGFFPEDGDGFVQEIDRTTGKLIGKRFKVGSPRGNVGSWAFAHWGGKFYVFVSIDDNSMVYEVDGKTGTSKRVREHLPTRIVGAGVSTCAPLLESVAP
jgi:hypothetical protein